MCAALSVLIDNGKLANQIARLVAIVAKSGFGSFLGYSVSKGPQQELLELKDMTGDNMLC